MKRYDDLSRQLARFRNEVASFFAPSIDATIASVEKLLLTVQPAVSVCSFHMFPITSSLTDVKVILLVGGFTASDWLYSNLQTHLGQRNLILCRPDNHV